jgi:hypothetical protein
MSQQEELLLKLHTLYKKRYQGQALEKKFNDAAVDLVETGDITKGAYIKFCAENDIEPDLTKLKSKPKETIVYRDSPSYDPCGGGGYSRSHC